MSQHPIIGITTYSRDENNKFSLPAEYIDAVRRAGGIPVLLPHGEPHLLDMLPLLDGVILSGGGDVDPALYNGQAHETIYMIDPERDSSEIELAKRVVMLELPLLPICRGTQVLNVALGGTLIEHLPDEVGNDILHRALPRAPAAHPIRVEPNSKLAQIMGRTEVSIASWHHQAVRKLAPGLQATAYAPDGTIEAIEMPGHPWLVALQWHPELTAADDPTQQAIFNALVEVARRRK
jgi:putative glutamine amidotransferase